MKLFIEWASDQPNPSARLSINDVYGSTPLHHAAIRDNVACAELLIAAGAAVDERDFQGMTPLHIACDHGRLKVRRRGDGGGDGGLEQVPTFRVTPAC